MKELLQKLDKFNTSRHATDLGKQIVYAGGALKLFINNVFIRILYVGEYSELEAYFDSYVKGLQRMNENDNGKIIYSFRY